MICFGSSLAQLKPKSFRIHEFFSEDLLLPTSLLTRNFKVIQFITWFVIGVISSKWNILSRKSYLVIVLSGHNVIDCITLSR
ncbi:conserved hypothetical protein [Cotesia vestalis bracovirus]|nr:conserved hypothetical protein [Cotesia vestalis bracovirus]